MGKIDSKILRSLKPVENAVFIEKAAVDGAVLTAKVIFTTNLVASKQKDFLKDTAAVERAFDKHFQGKGHIIVESIYQEEKAGVYGAFVHINTPVMDADDAVKENSGMHLIAANVFADADDNIWEVREDANGKRILLKNLVEDLSSLFVPSPNPTMALAAAGIDVTSELEVSSLITFFDTTSGEYRHAAMVDTASAYDFKAKEIRKISPLLAIATSGKLPELDRNLTAIMGQETAADITSAKLNNLFDYLDTLYGHAPAFLSVYKNTIENILTK